MKTSSRLSILLILTEAITGCSLTSVVSPVTVDSQDEAAAVLFSVTGVAPWNQIADAMQPNFSLNTGDKALDEALPITLRFQEQKLRALDANLAIGLVPDGSSISNDSNINEEIIPETPNGAPAGGNLPTGFSNEGNVTVSPLLKFQVAKGLLQSIQLMNQEVHNAALLGCYVPYLISAKIGVQPYRPNLGYDLNTRIAFFPTDKSNNRNTEKQTKPDSTIYSKQENRAYILSSFAKIEKNSQGMACMNANDIPKVVPILATDDLERAMKSRSEEVALQIALAASGLGNATGGKLSVNNLNQTVNAIIGSDLNSRLTVTREVDNVINVKIGASNQATAGEALVGQNYDISLILLVPRSYFNEYLDSGSAKGPSLVSGPIIQALSYTQFRNAVTGEVLSPRSPDTFLSQFDEVMKEILSGTGNSELLIEWADIEKEAREQVGREIHGYIRSGNYEDFNNKLFFSTDNPTEIRSDFFRAKDIIKNIGPLWAPSLWTRASTILSDSPFKSHFIQLRLPEPITVPAQTAAIIDNRIDNATIQLANVYGDSIDSLMAAITFTPKGNRNAVVLRAQINLDRTKKLLTFIFPSLNALGVTEIEKNGKLEITQRDCSPEELCPKLMIPESFDIWLPVIKPGLNQTKSAPK
ncbi:hypothetical protein [Methylomonas sp. MgM2]